MSDSQVEAFANVPQGTTAGLKVNLGADNDITVISGAITADLGTNNDIMIDVVSAGNGAMDMEVLFASFSNATQADNEVVAADGTKKIRVLSYTINAAGGAQTITWKSATTALSGAMDLADNGFIHASCIHGLFATVANQALNLANSAATLTTGHITYVLEL
ncbi:hypothetical protein LCGC14_3085180 [marine sediment metagenome]|uniref:Uncharacterized protein n=1 Tax=marine sediment metagenome TaxID=412755 RepID=A0A0F8X0R8_9ZZZZ